MAPLSSHVEWPLDFFINAVIRVVPRNKVISSLVPIMEQGAFFMFNNLMR